MKIDFVIKEDRIQVLSPEIELGYIKDNCSLGNLCYDNSTIYIPSDKEIIGFNYEKSIYKKFKSLVVSTDSKLRKVGNKMIVTNEKEVYEIGGN